MSIAPIVARRYSLYDDSHDMWESFNKSAKVEQWFVDASRSASTSIQSRQDNYQ